MRVLNLSAPDGLDAVSLDSAPLPEPMAGEVRVALKAASLNHRELWITRGLYPGMSLPTSMGCDGTGIIDAVGQGVDPLRVGDRVLLYPGLHWGSDPLYPSASFGLLGMPGPGTLADYIVVPAENAIAKPAHLGWEAAAALPLGVLTAWRGLFTKGRLKSGDHVLVTGVGGGVATFAAELAVASGAEVFVTSGSDETLAKAQALGARAGFNYRDPDWGRALSKITGGIDLVFDAAPASGFPAYGRSLKMGARVVVYGSTGGTTFMVNAPEIFLKNIEVIGTNVGNPAEFAAAIAFVAENRIEPAIDRQFSLENVKEALTYLDGSHGFGKVVITI